MTCLSHEQCEAVIASLESLAGHVNTWLREVGRGAAQVNSTQVDIRSAVYDIGFAANVARAQRDKLKFLLYCARTGTRPDGSGCWCNPEEWRNEFPDDDPRDIAMPGHPRQGSHRHTALCYDITEAIK